MLTTLAAVISTLAPTVPAIVPRPVLATPGQGEFVLNELTHLVAPKELEPVARQAQYELRPATGFAFDLARHGGRNTIELSLDRALIGKGGEAYVLDVTSDHVRIAGGGPAGVYYGLQSLRQLLPPAVLRKAKVSGIPWSVPAFHIEDEPRFGWRGLHIDTSRHFIPKSEILKFIDLLALHKMNTLHLHLTDDQGWRIEIKKYPKLTEIGSMRKQSMAGYYTEHRFDGKPHGGFYTQDDLREIVAYAQARFVNVVPEIEMPGHSQAALAAYPEFGNTGKTLDVGEVWGVYNNIYSPDDKTIHFLQDILTEVLELFPSKFIHVGGDEVPKDQWKESPAAQAKMKALGLKNEEELQSWFIHQMDQFLASKGRRLVGWDEILEGGLAPGATVMSWRGEEGGIAAAKAGHDVVMTPGQYTYFDHYQSKNQAKEPLAIGGFLPLRTVYDYDPVPPQLSPEEAKHVLGAQGQLWTEYIPDSRQLEYMAFPRACALAEALWLPHGAKNFDDFVGRLSTDLVRLQILDVNYRKLDDEQLEKPAEKPKFQ